MLRNIFKNTQDSLQQKLLKGWESWWGMDSLQKPFTPNADTLLLFPVSGLPGSSLVHSNRMYLFLHTFSCQLPSNLHWWLLANNHRWKLKKSCTHVIWKLIQLLKVVHLKCIWEHLIKYLRNSYMSTFTSNTFISEEISWKDMKSAQLAQVNFKMEKDKRK